MGLWELHDALLFSLLGTKERINPGRPRCHSERSVDELKLWGKGVGSTEHRLHIRMERLNLPDDMPPTSDINTQSGVQFVESRARSRQHCFQLVVNTK